MFKDEENKKQKGKGNTMEIIIETPKGSRCKYILEEATGHIKLKKSMPLGFSFPFDFGMIPGTLAEDGDPVDVLLLMEEAVYPGVFVDVRIIGGLKADQQKTRKNRNDRIIAVEPTCPVYGHLQSVNDLSPAMMKQIENFFVSYNQVQGKTFTSLGWADADEARQLIADAVVKQI
ncbi:MAG: inorganic diphosphatase [Pedobacter sp.]|nr:MAG: inorganic diphosphatase [Pedobacter sp.]